MRSRRDFLLASAAAGFAGFTIAGTKASGQVLGSNERVRIGVAGINGRGRSHISEFAGGKESQVTYLIDPDSRLFDDRSKEVREKGGNTPTCVQDARAALEDKNLDALSIATTNHWHSLLTVWACQAGKDVYVEKPLSHNVFEGRQCVAAAKKYGRVVQHGTQNRSSGGKAALMATIHSGKYGKLLVSKGYCCKSRWSIGHKPVAKPASGFDFDVWLGPARPQEFHGNLHPYNWHWFWDFGNGDTGNQGVHEIDIARWAIKDATLPTEVWSLGGRFVPGEADQGQTPNMQLSVMRFGETLLVFETRGLVGKNGVPGKVTNEFYTTDGVLRDGKFFPKSGGPGESIKTEPARVTPGGAFGSFLNAVRTRKAEDINCDAEVGHYSSALCHLANISYRLGEPAKFDAGNQSLGDNVQVVEAFNNLKDNLKAVDIQLDSLTYQVGRSLRFDPAAEKFVGDDEANALLTRAYREPYVVPEKV